MGGEPDIEGMVEGGERKDVPGVGGDNEGGDEIDFVGGIRAAVAADRANVRMQALLASALDLDAEKASVVLDGEIVGGAFTPGLGDAQSVFGGASHEAEFSPFATLLRVGKRHI